MQLPAIKTLNKNTFLLGLVVVLLLVSIVEGVLLIKIKRSTSQNSAVHALRRHPDDAFNLPDHLPQPFDHKDWNPMDEFNSMQEQMERMFDNSFNRFRHSPFFNEEDGTGSIIPQTDLEDLGDKYQVTMNLPGAEKGEIEVTIKNDTLNVTTKSRLSKTDQQGKSFLRMERRLGSFQRSLSLPGPVDEKNMETEFVNGVLTITLPKRAS